MSLALLEKLKLAAEGVFLIGGFVAIAHFADLGASSPTTPLAAQPTSTIAVAQVAHDHP